MRGRDGVAELLNTFLEGFESLLGPRGRIAIPRDIHRDAPCFALELVQGNSGRVSLQGEASKRQD